MDVCSDLAEEDGHAVVVEEEGLWKARVVELEEEGGEAQMWRTAETEHRRMNEAASFQPLRWIEHGH